MELLNLHLDRLVPANWNPNTMGSDLVEKLASSIRTYGVVENLVVRPMGDSFEVLSGNQRLSVYRRLRIDSVPCVVVELDDAQARILAQVLNRTRGEDNIGLKSELLRQVMENIPQSELIALLPETVESLNMLSTLGQETLAQHLEAWENARKARLHTLQLRLSEDQLHVVREALNKAVPQAKSSGEGNPNLRGNALYIICCHFLRWEAQP